MPEIRKNAPLRSGYGEPTSRCSFKPFRSSCPAFNTIPSASHPAGERKGAHCGFAGRLRSGVVGLFWAMVVAIVAARAAYFDPALSEKVASVAALFGHLRTVVGV